MSAYREELIERGDLDELTRYVERVTDQADWDELVWIRDDCRAAATRGKQLWPVTAFVDYALALRGAGRVRGRGHRGRRGTGCGRGPVRLWPADRGGRVDASVAARSPRTCTPAQRPASSRTSAWPAARTCPATTTSTGPSSTFRSGLAAWEPDYEPAMYSLEKAEFPSPPMPGHSAVGRSLITGRRVSAHADGDEGRGCLARSRGALGHGVERSHGRVRGRGRRVRRAAIARAQPGPHHRGQRRRRRSRTWPGPPVPVARTAVGAASRRVASVRGGPPPRWSTCCTTGRSAPTSLSDAIHEMHWYLWDEGVDPIGWSLRLAVEDPESELAWALIAADAD